MTIIKRFAFYLGGFTIGIILLFFFLGGKKTSCDYSPNSRVLKNIRIKERHFSEKAMLNLRQQQWDTSSISSLLLNGDVLFSESNTDLDSCKIYIVEGIFSEVNIKMKVENCDSIATILELVKVR